MNYDIGFRVKDFRVYNIEDEVVVNLSIAFGVIIVSQGGCFMLKWVSKE